MVVSNKYIAPKAEQEARDYDYDMVIPLTTASGASLNPAAEQEIDLRQMDEQDLKSLQKTDPFMYYSVPGVHKASVLFKDVDYSDIASLSRADDGAHSSRQGQGQYQPSQEGEAASKVSRRTRLSFECHPSVLMEEIMGDMFEEQEFDELDLDGLLSMLARARLSRQ